MPKLRAPAGAVDTHIHLFGPASQYPFHPGSKYVSEDILPEHNIARIFRSLRHPPICSS
jgi:2-pyrone-4,6-dicarboxylate lactonase